MIVFGSEAFWRLIRSEAGALMTGIGVYERDLRALPYPFRCVRAQQKDISPQTKKPVLTRLQICQHLSLGSQPPDL